MKTYNYEARNEDKYNNVPEPHPEDQKYYKQNNYPKSQLEVQKPNPVHEQLEELECVIKELTEVQRNLINRLVWVSISNPSDRPEPEICGETKLERPDSEIVQRIKRSVRNVRGLKYSLSIQLEDLDV